MAHKKMGPKEVTLSGSNPAVKVRHQGNPERGHHKGHHKGMHKRGRGRSRSY